ncbi:alkyl hydroperoxide reductase AhpD [Elstera cyanobacteriorum]|uniref:Alkylhydroperoxidase n=1 Tax=Elstera cyanobacteriorum TaxID=2022747 RepID=A0A255XLP4_9PROT|nr:carboxymuconolactone decarboxylase family protein [Elstera cyanobacteriorum]OYQ17889.1 alkylhydroperoxidase [Elstera cyanobacteriorum]GFZ85291.1 alkyl hydroperoxide reductase AhpD [Elstera cyanobacteriorum]
MTPQRLNPYHANPKAYEALIALETYLKTCGLEYSLIELIKTRASQINGCAFCLHMHTTDARKAGESELRLHLLAAWRESSLYTPRERAALGWTEALTLLSQTGAPEAEYAAFQAEFTPAEQVDVTALIGMINLWNRLAVGFRLAHPKAA